MSWNAIGYSLLVVEFLVLVALPRAWIGIVTVMLGVAATTGLITVVLLAQRFIASLPPAG
jgi:hypothetical protein